MPDLPDQTVLEGTLEQIAFQSPDGAWSVLKLQSPAQQRPYTVTGNFGRVVPGEVLRVKGRWSEHPRYGATFRVSSYETTGSATLTGIRKYLSSGVIKGLGEATARKLTDHFGMETLELLDKNPEKIFDVPGIQKKRAKKIVKAWKGESKLREMLVFLQGYGVSPAYARKIYARYQDQTVAMVRENPYRLATEIRGIGFKKADAIAMHLGHAEDSPFRADAAVRYMLRECSTEGNTYYPRQELVSRIARQLGVAAAVADEAVDRLATRGRVILLDGRVYLPHLFRAEYEIAARLGAMAQVPGSFDDQRLELLISEGEKRVGVELDPNQRQAVLAVFRNRLVVITGGPGTGKTTLLRVLISVFRKLDLEVLCASPTGRAAKRMAEATGHKASTIHRLLQYQPPTRSFLRNEENPLQGDLLAIDEASMLDTMLTCSLVRALPKDACFVLIGDIDQLPSVGPGNVLRDLIASELFALVRLQKIFRQAEESLIVTNAHRINRGRMPICPPDGGARRDFFLAPAQAPARALEVVKLIVSERIPKVFGLDPVQDVQVLAPMYSGIVGVDSLNQELQILLNPGEEGIRYRKIQFRAGDKVMQIVNDYDKQVFNGDIGRVEMVDLSEQTLLIDFSGRRIPYAKSELDALTLAYAVTVHKSQGSEYPAVVMLLMNQHYVMLRRNLLYTGLTRARKLAVVVGQQTALYRAVKHNPSAQRYTSLTECLLGTSPS